MSVNPTSVAKLKSMWGRGRILYAHSDFILDFAGWGFNPGHTGMMAYESWDPTWDTDGNAMISITSFAAPSGPTFWGGKDGVQEEPLAVWAGKCDAAAKKVSVLRVVNEVSRLVWKNWRLSVVTSYDKPMNSELAEAVRNANRYKGQPYCTTIRNVIVNKNVRTSLGGPEFVCSSLLWQAWKEVGNDFFYKYELDATWWDFSVTPHNIYTARTQKCSGHT